MEKYEYLTHVSKVEGLFGGDVEINTMQLELNQFGNDGWELVNSVCVNLKLGATSKIVNILKRKVLN